MTKRPKTCWASLPHQLINDKKTKDTWGEHTVSTKTTIKTTTNYVIKVILYIILTVGEMLGNGFALEKGANGCTLATTHVVYEERVAWSPNSQ